MSRKVSVRIPQPLWSWLIVRAGNKSVSAVVVDCLSQVRSGNSRNGTRFCAWGILTIAVGLGMAYLFIRLRRQRRKRLLG